MSVKHEREDFHMSKMLSGRELVAAVAGPRAWSDTRQSWLNRAAKRAGLSYRTIRAVFYGEINKSDHPCVRLLQIEAQRRMDDAAARIETLARSMHTTDPDFYGADSAALLEAAEHIRGAARSLRPVGRPRTVPGRDPE
jgi:hypothetical protein